MTKPASGPPAAQLAGFIAKYTPEVAARARAALRTMRKRLPGAVELVYDNSNGDRVRSDGAGVGPAVLDHALSTLGEPLLRAREGLPDPEERLRGSGSRIRHVVLENAGTIDDPAVRALIDHAVAAAGRPFDGARRGRIVVKSVSAKQRPRCPA